MYIRLIYYYINICTKVIISYRQLKETANTQMSVQAREWNPTDIQIEHTQSLFRFIKALWYFECEIHLKFIFEVNLMLWH